MHWSHPTAIENANEGGTFFVNACFADGRGSETHKAVTCKNCKELLVRPRSSTQIAARLVQTVIELQEEGADRKDYANFFYVEVSCNACPNDIDVSTWSSSVQLHLLVDQARLFLEHCAFEHMGGAEPMVKRCYSVASAYELNLAMGKPAMTMHEEAWRERVEAGEIDAKV
jgi:hypothetical protein